MKNEAYKETIREYGPVLVQKSGLSIDELTKWYGEWFRIWYLTEYHYGDGRG